SCTNALNLTDGECAYANPCWNMLNIWAEISIIPPIIPCHEAVSSRAAVPLPLRIDAMQTLGLSDAHERGSVTDRRAVALDNALWFRALA
ncbi:hypothetical protein, partial [Methylobacterium sp. WL30]|uniref:hypothetical protein n=1 Tax=Methylobacterium sp. WL30 TaxID=2603895 RepID=UPI001FEEB9ED